MCKHRGVYARLFVLAVRVRRVQRAARNAVRKLEELKETV